MKKTLLGLALAAGLTLISASFPARAADEPKAAADAAKAAADTAAKAADSAKTATDAAKAEDGFVTIFNGKDLMGWRGLEEYWSVKDGAIVGKETKETSKQTFLVFDGGNVKDFELHLKFKFATPTGNSGIQFRSKLEDAATSKVGGYQADFDATNQYTGIIYDEAGVAGGRGIMSKRGMKTHWGAADKPEKEEPLAKSDAEIKQAIKIGDWNDVVLKVQGNHVLYQINGVTTTDMTDDSPKALKEGLIAFQLHKGFTMEIHFKDIKLKKL
jgi:hypothetical protein